MDLPIIPFLVVSSRDFSHSFFSYLFIGASLLSTLSPLTASLLYFHLSSATPQECQSSALWFSHTVQFLFAVATFLQGSSISLAMIIPNLVLTGHERVAWYIFSLALSNLKQVASLNVLAVLRMKLWEHCDYSSETENNAGVIKNKYRLTFFPTH